jgi:nitric-oxide synthase, brain
MEKHTTLHKNKKKKFMTKFHNLDRFNSPAHQARWQQIEKEIQVTAGYQLNDSELIFGAKTAWRNSARCIGRIQWSKLQVKWEGSEKLFPCSELNK